MGQISVHVDITATPGTGEHKVTVKGIFWVHVDQTAYKTLTSQKIIISKMFFLETLFFKIYIKLF